MLHVIQYSEGEPGVRTLTYRRRTLVFSRRISGMFARSPRPDASSVLRPNPYPSLPMYTDSSMLHSQKFGKGHRSGKKVSGMTRLRSGTSRNSGMTSFPTPIAAIWLSASVPSIVPTSVPHKPPTSTVRRSAGSATEAPSIIYAAATMPNPLCARL